MSALKWLSILGLELLTTAICLALPTSILIASLVWAGFSCFWLTLGLAT